MADTSTSSPILSSLIAGLAIVPPLLANAISWAKDLNRSARKQRVLDEATKSIGFWDAWLETKGENPAESDRTRYNNRVEQVARLVDRHADEERIKPLESITLPRKIALLVRSPSASFSSLRLYYYYFITVTLIVWLQAFRVIPEFAPKSWHVPVWLSGADRVFTFIDAIVFAVICLSFWFAAVDKYRSAEEEQDAVRPA